jgi:hypothetical protein
MQNENIENHMVLNGPDAPWNQPDADEPTPEEKREQAEREARAMKSAEFADGLRQLADFLEENPDVPLPHGAMFSFLSGREEFVKAAVALAKGGKVEKSADDPSGVYPQYHAKRTFGEITFDIQIPRSKVCRLVSPAVYECPDSLLEESKEYTEAA